MKRSKKINLKDEKKKFFLFTHFFILVSLSILFLNWNQKKEKNFSKHQLNHQSHLKSTFLNPKRTEKMSSSLKVWIKQVSNSEVHSVSNLEEEEETLLEGNFQFSTELKKIFFEWILDESKIEIISGEKKGEIVQLKEPLTTHTIPLKVKKKKLKSLGENTLRPLASNEVLLKEETLQEEDIEKKSLTEPTKENKIFLIIKVPSLGLQKTALIKIEN